MTSRRSRSRNVEVPTLDGDNSYKVPEGTQSGTTFRLRGKGMPDVSGRGRGDLFFTVQAVTPKKLTKEQRALLDQLSKVLPQEKFDPRPKEADEDDKNIFEKVKEFWVACPRSNSGPGCDPQLSSSSSQSSTFRPTASQERTIPLSARVFRHVDAHGAARARRSLLAVTCSRAADVEYEDWPHALSTVACSHRRPQSSAPRGTLHPKSGADPRLVRFDRRWVGPASRDNAAHTQGAAGHSTVESNRARHRLRVRCARTGCRTARRAICGRYRYRS